MVYHVRFMLWFLSVFLPGLNWKNCDEPDIGYTCKDLEYGVGELQKLIERPRHYNLTYLVNSKFISTQIFLRTVTVALSLALDAVPVFRSGMIEKYPQLGIPDIARLVDKKPKRTEFGFICNTWNSMSYNRNISADPITFPFLLLNPTVNSLAMRLGPAGYHILANYALNMSQEVKHTNENISLEQHALDYFENTIYTEDVDIIGAIGCNGIVHRIGDDIGWMLSLLRGRPSVLYDPVSKSCFKAKSYLAGLLNPLYPGTWHSNNDLSKANEFCGDYNITRSLLTHLL